MKKLLCLSTFFLFAFCLMAQQDTTVEADTTTYRIIKTDGGELIGQVLSSNPREMLILTQDKRKIYVPQHVVKELVPLTKTDFNSQGQFIGEDKFATRYFITTNGLPLKKGEHYVQWNLYGPDFQFSLSENLGAGIMTSWLGVPIIGNIKYSFELDENSHLALGLLAGTGSWTVPEAAGLLPFATLSFGNRTRNIAFSGGYGALFFEGDAEGRALLSMAAMAKVGPKISLVFDSFFLLPTNEKREEYDYYNGRYVTTTRRNDLFALIIPGLRWHQAEGQAFQFGFTGAYVAGDLVPVPIPMVQWYRSF